VGSLASPFLFQRSGQDTYLSFLFSRKSLPEPLRFSATRSGAFAPLLSVELLRPDVMTLSVGSCCWAPPRTLTSCTYSVLLILDFLYFLLSGSAPYTLTYLLYLPLIVLLVLGSAPYTYLFLLLLGSAPHTCSFFPASSTQYSLHLTRNSYCIEPLVAVLKFFAPYTCSSSTSCCRAPPSQYYLRLAVTDWFTPRRDRTKNGSALA